MAGALEGDVFIGRRAQEFRGLLKIKYPMEHGIVTDWDDMERIWNWVYAEELGTLSEEVRPPIASSPNPRNLIQQSILYSSPRHRSTLGTTETSQHKYSSTRSTSPPSTSPSRPCYHCEPVALGLSLLCLV